MNLPTAVHYHHARRKAKIKKKLEAPPLLPLLLLLPISSNAPRCTEYGKQECGFSPDAVVVVVEDIVSPWSGLCLAPRTTRNVEGSLGREAGGGRDLNAPVFSLHSPPKVMSA
jgi:hypothetical protein